MVVGLGEWASRSVTAATTRFHQGRAQTLKVASERTGARLGEIGAAPSPFDEEFERNMARFREVEQRQQPSLGAPPRPRTVQEVLEDAVGASIPEDARPTPEQTAIHRGLVSPDPALAGVRKPGFESLISDIFRQTGRVAGGPGLGETFLPENLGGLAPRIPAQLVDVETRAAARYAELLEETRQSFPSRTPPGTTHESLAFERLDEEMGDELRAVQPQDGKGLFGKILSAGLRGTEALVLGRPGAGKEILEDVGAGIQFLETKELGGGPFYRQPGTGKTAFEEGAEISRPVVDVGTDIAAEPFEQVEAAGIPVVSPAAGGVSDRIDVRMLDRR